MLAVLIPQGFIRLDMSEYQEKHEVLILYQYISVPPRICSQLLSFSGKFLRSLIFTVFADSRLTVKIHQNKHDFMVQNGHDCVHP